MSSIANQILEQIPRNEMWAIGAKNYMSYSPTKLHLGGLCFHASLFGKRRCVVHVLLNGRDLYDVKVFTHKGKLYRESTDIFCEDMACSVLNKVEAFFRGVP